MKEYLEYLDRLNSLVDANEFEKVREECEQCKTKNCVWGYLSIILWILTIGLAPRALDVFSKLVRACLHGATFDTVETVLWVSLYVVSITLALWLSLTYIDSKYKLNSMLRISYVEHSYATIRNTIIDEGEEFMQKLFLWERLYTLTVEDKRKYDYVLKVIRALRVEYERFENKGV